MTLFTLNTLNALASLGNIFSGDNKMLLMVIIGAVAFTFVFVLLIISTILRKTKKAALGALIASLFKKKKK